VRATAWIWLLVAACSANGSDSNPSSTGGGDDSDSHPQNKPPALLLDGIPSAGSKIFQDTCGTAICHGPDGSGGSTNAKDLSKVVPKLTDVEIVDVMTNGYLVMPPQQLEDQQMADVLSYLRQQWGGG
jgi:mono/diheme cytochrome c family protein